MAENSEPTGQGTRAHLISAALELFGKQGFAATSTRQIAARAGTNIGSISYHFGGKAELHRACAAAVAQRIHEAAGPPQDTSDLTADEAQERLESMIKAMISFLAGDPRAEEVANFILAELARADVALERLYSDVFLPKHREICGLWARVTGQPSEDREVILTVFAMIGQVVYFRIGRQFVNRRMGWEKVGPVEVEQITDVVIANLRSALKRSMV